MDENILEPMEPWAEPPEFYLIIPEYNSQGRLCNYHTGKDAEIKVMAEEWERFNRLAGRQHTIIDGVVAYDESLEPCMPDDLARAELSEVESRLLEILGQERLDEACGIIKPAVMSFGMSEKDLLIAERDRLKSLLGA